MEEFPRKLVMCSNSFKPKMHSNVRTNLLAELANNLGREKCSDMLQAAETMTLIAGFSTGFSTVFS